MLARFIHLNGLNSSMRELLGFVLASSLFENGGSALAVAMSGPALQGCEVAASLASGQIRLAGA